MDFLKYGIPKFQIVLLHSPASHWNDPQVRRHFDALVRLKLEGYAQVYPADRFLPLDTYDWIGSHLLIYMYLPDGYKLVLAYKFIELSTCDQYGLPFAFSSGLKSAPPDYSDALSRIMAPIEAGHKSVAYFSAWANLPIIRALPWAKAFNSLALSLIAHIHRDLQIDESVILAGKKVKTHEALQRVGYKILASNSGKPLPPLSLRSANNELVYPLHLQEFTPEAQAHAEDMRAAWEARIEVGTYPKFARILEKKKAA